MDHVILLYHNLFYFRAFYTFLLNLLVQILLHLHLQLHLRYVLLILL